VTGKPGPLPVEEMPGGASTRRFFRVDLGDGRSAVAMFVPDATQSDEIVKADEGGRRWPFLEVRDLLHERGVAVPAVLAEACDDGFVLVEDLGEDTLARYLERHPDKRGAKELRAMLRSSGLAAPRLAAHSRCRPLFLLDPTNERRYQSLVSTRG